MLKKVQYLFLCTILHQVFDGCGAFKSYQYQQPAVSRRLRYLTWRYAPLVYLAKNETFRPSDVNSFLRQTSLVNATSTDGRPLTQRNLPTCTQCRLVTNEPLVTSLSDNLTLFRGQDVSKGVTTYVLVNGTFPGEVEIEYWFFYPYNRGTSICIGNIDETTGQCGPLFFNNVCLSPRNANGECIGVPTTAGHHVGDWERIFIKFSRPYGKPDVITYFAHGHPRPFTLQKNGKYVYEPEGEELEFTCGRIQRPIVYSGLGSHASWNHAGKELFAIQPGNNRLFDYMSSGEKWKTWKKLQIFRRLPVPGSYTGSATFLNFLGRWGNPERDCLTVTEINVRFCIQTEAPDGPTGE